MASGVVSQRNESALSQVLRLTNWLRKATDEESISFMKAWQAGSTTADFKSLGELFASFLIKTHSVVLSPDTISRLVEHCRKHLIRSQTNPSPSSSPSRSNSNSISNFNGVTVIYPCTKNSPFYLPLLSLPVDVFNHLGNYLVKEEGIKLGYCSHEFYNATQNIQFLKAAGMHCLTLNGAILNKIIDGKIDPWSWCVGCCTLQLTLKSTSESISNRDDSDVKGIKKTVENLRRLLQKESNETSQWIDVLFDSIEELEIHEAGALMFDSISMVQCLFSKLMMINQNQNEKQKEDPNKCKYNYIGRVKNLKLTFDDINDRDHIQSIEKFAQSYDKYYKNKYNSKKSKIRTIDSITIGSVNCLRDDVFAIYNAIKLFQPNYSSFIMNNEIVRFNCLNAFCDIFHKNLKQLCVYSVRFNDIRILHECLQQAAFEGKYLRIGNKILDEFFDYERANKYKALFSRNFQAVQAIQQDIHDDNYDDNINRLSRLYTRNFGNVNEMDKYIAGRSEDDAVCIISKYVLRCWLLRFLDEKIEKMNDSGVGSDSDSDSSDSDKDDDRDTGDNRDKDVLGSILAGKNTPKIKKLIFDDGHPVWQAYNLFMQPFNDIFNNQVGYRLLNWRKTVQHLCVSFVPRTCTKYASIDEITLYKEEFNKAMCNIFEYFNNLKKLAIEFKFHSNQVVKRENESESAGESDFDSYSKDDDENDHPIDQWIDVFYSSFKCNIDKMIDKFEATTHSSFCVYFSVTIGNLMNGSPTDMFDYLYCKNKLNKPSHFKKRYKPVAKLHVMSGIKGNGNKTKTDFGIKYYKHLVAMKTMISQFKQCNAGELDEQSFCVWKGARIVRAKPNANTHVQQL